eukprot:ANDGO_05939.mRNA.1 25S rRNA adenine-N(1) methyltransferase
MRVKPAIVPVSRKPRNAKRGSSNEVEMPFSSVQEAHDLISRFHTLNKDIGLLRASGSISESEKREKISGLERQLDDLGGLEKYQRASLFGEMGYQHRFNSAKWVVKDLCARERRPSKQASGMQAKLSLLDVGAITNHYRPYQSWILPTSIDLHSFDPDVIQIDFFEFAKCYDDDPFDVVVLSLVLNFVGSPEKKGEMIARCEDLVKVGGLLYVVLPVACVENSRYLKHSLWLRMLKSVGFSVLDHRTSSKLSFYVFQRTEDSLLRTAHHAFPKKLCRSGDSRNNFCVVMQPAH